MHPFEKKINEINRKLDILIKDGGLKEINLILLDNADIMRLFKISRKTTQKWREKKVFPYYRIQGKIFYKLSEIIEVIERNRVNEKEK